MDEKRPLNDTGKGREVIEIDDDLVSYRVIRYQHGSCRDSPVGLRLTLTLSLINYIVTG